AAVADGRQTVDVHRTPDERGRGRQSERVHDRLVAVDGAVAEDHGAVVVDAGGDADDEVGAGAVHSGSVAADGRTADGRRAEVADVKAAGDRDRAEVVRRDRARELGGVAAHDAVFDRDGATAVDPAPV